MSDDKSAVPLHFWKACVIMFLLQTQEIEMVYSYSLPLKSREPQSPVKVISYMFRLHIPTINKFKGFRRANSTSSSLKSSSRPMRKLGFAGLRASPKTKVRTNKNSKPWKDKLNPLNHNTQQTTIRTRYQVKLLKPENIGRKEAHAKVMLHEAIYKYKKLLEICDFYLSTGTLHATTPTRVTRSLRV